MKPRVHAFGVLLTLCVTGSARPAAAQRPDLHLAGQIASIAARTIMPGSTIPASGTVFGAEGRVTYRRLFARASYGEGSLDHEGPGARDLVEGFAQIGVAPLPFVEVAVGPLVRAYSTPATTSADPVLLRLQLGDGSPDARAAPAVTQRWVLWQIRGRFHAPIRAGSDRLGLRAFADLWTAVQGDVDLPEPFDRAQGGEAGLILRWTAPTVFTFSVSYAIDETQLGDAGRRDTVERLSAALGIVLGAARPPHAPGPASTSSHTNRRQQHD